MSILFSLLLAAVDVTGSAQKPRVPIQDSGVVKIGGGGGNWYEGVYGKPIHWPLREMERGNYPRDGQAFWTHGLLQVFGPMQLLCLEEETFCLPLRPVPEIADALHGSAVRAGDWAKVIGVFDVNVAGSAAGVAPSPPPGRPPTGPGPAPPGRVGRDLTFWSFESGPGFRQRGSGGESSLEALVLQPARFDGRTVTVEGRFRGRNLFDDLPSKSGGSESDWVLRDGPFSVWVTGRLPRGKGWRLDPASRSDTAWRVAVEARVSYREGLVVLEARQVRLLQRESEPSP